MIHKKVLIICVLIMSLFALSGCEELTKELIDQLPPPDGSSPTDSNTNTPSDSSDTLRIASFNIQVLGVSKMDKPLAVEYLPRIIQRYDIVAIQEYRDKSGEAIEELHDLLPGYEKILSTRLGRTSSKEQYVIFYDEGKVRTTKIFDDPDDIFEREPYVVYMQAGGHDFSIISNHIKPDDAEAEIESLGDIISMTQAWADDDDFILLGDLNADCSYYDEDLSILREYDWAITNSMDTTVSDNDCTYDRIITNMDYTGSGVFYYDAAYGLNQDDAKIISDHYPVYIELEWL